MSDVSSDANSDDLLFTHTAIPPCTRLRLRLKD